MCDRQNRTVMETTQIDVWCIKQEEDEEENKRALQELRRSLDQEEMDTDSRSTEPSEMNVEASKMNVEPNEIIVDSSSIKLNEMNVDYNLDSIELQELKCTSFSDLGQREEMDIDSISTLCEPSETPVGCTSKLNEPQGLNTEFVSKSSDSHSKLKEPEALKACPKTGNSRESNPSSDQFKEIETGSALTLSSSISENKNTCEYANDTQQDHDDEESNVYCLICSKDLDSRLHYTYHMKVLHHIIIPEAQSETETSIEINDPNYYCNQCKISFTTRSNYHKHLDYVHKMNIFFTRQQKPLHPELVPDIHNPLLFCAPCEKGFDSIHNFQLHLIIVHRMMNHSLQFSGHAFECKTCACLHDSKQSYKMHYLQVHQIHVISIAQQKIPYPEIIPNIEDPGFHCAACNETLSNQIVYNMHLYDLHDINPFITYDAESSEEFYDATPLFEESDSSHSIAQCQLTPDKDDVSNYCNSCQFTFPTRCSYHGHLSIIHHFDIPVSINDPEIRHIFFVPDKNNPFNYCNICEFTFVRKLDFQSHLNRTHEVDLIYTEYTPEIIHPNKTPNINNVHLFCNVCEYTFLSKEDYHHHLSIVHPHVVISNTELTKHTQNINLETKIHQEDQLQQGLINASNMVPPVEANSNNDRVCLDNSQTETNKKEATIANYCDKCKPSFISSRFCVKHFLPFPPRAMRQARKLNRFVTPTFHDAQKTNANHDKQTNVNNDTVKPAKKLKKTRLHCSSCNRNFWSKRSYGGHMGHHHKKSFRPLIKKNHDIDDPHHHCANCNKTYSSRLSYGNHLRYMHQIKIPNLQSKKNK